MKQLLLLLRHYSFLPLGTRWPQTTAELPRVLWLLPLWGLFAGLLCWGAARLLWPMSYYWAAALLLGVNVLLNGGVWLRDVMLLAEGRRPLTVTQGAGRNTPAPPTDAPAAPVVFGRRALVAGSMYLLLHYLCLLALLRLGLRPAPFIAGAICCRWVYVWGVYDFAARYPAFLHLGMERRHFSRACFAALPLVAACASVDYRLWPALLAALLAAWLFYRLRLRYLGALDEPAYGAAAAWAEIMLYVVYVLV